jgi:hypothetical protein
MPYGIGNFVENRQRWTNFFSKMTLVTIKCKEFKISASYLY